MFPAPALSALATTSFNPLFLELVSLRSFNTNPLELKMLLIVLVAMVIWHLASSVAAWWKLRKFPAASWTANLSYLYGFLGSLRVLWPGTSAAADVSWMRKILFSKPFLQLLGPTSRDKTGFGALMG